jgi:transforming growth factor-beta-induced protein
MKFLAAALLLLLAGYHQQSANAQTIVDLIVQSRDHTILEAAVLAAPPAILTTLNTTGSSYTVFAPTDNAFEEEFPSDYLDLIVTPAWSNHLVCLLTAHVLPGTVRSSAFTTNATQLPTLNADYNVSLVLRGDEAMVDGVPITTADLNATNGVIHVISRRPITPPCIANSIVTVAESMDDFNTLVSLIEDSDLADLLLREIGPFTVFAPTNAAFDKLPAGTLEALRGNERLLAEVLEYHIIEGNAYASGLTSLTAVTNLTTLNGSNITVSASGGTVKVNTATVTKTDVLAGNGVIHAIDTVLLPLDFNDPRRNNLDVVFASRDHEILRDALESVPGLLDSLDALESYTLFAPSDDAFAATVPEDTLNRLFRREWSRHLACVLQEHVISGPAVLSTAITNGLTAQTLNDNTLAFAVSQVNNGTTITVDNITISTPDLVTRDGVVHVIDGVILPDCVSLSIYDVASGATDLSTLKTLVDLVPGLNETLSSPGGWTLFAPTNAAFAKLDPTLVASLRSNVTALMDVLTYHVLDDVWALEGDLLEEETVETVQGATLAFAMNAANVSTVNGIAIADKELLAGNGVIYLVDTVLSQSQTAAPVAAPVVGTPVAAPTTAPAGTMPASVPVGTLPTSNATIPTTPTTGGSPVVGRPPVTTGAPIMRVPSPPISAPASGSVVVAARSVMLAVLVVTAVTLSTCL